MKKLSSFIYFVGPIIAALLGMYAVSIIDISPTVFIPNFIAAALGIPLVIFMAPRWNDWNHSLVVKLAIASIALLLISFLFPGPSDVHRWINLGLININVSMLILPITLFCLHQFLHNKKFLYGFVLFFSATIILIFQPDAGQVSSFCLAALVVFFYNKMDIKLRLMAVLFAGLSILLAWNRIDLLESVEYVEEIFYLIIDLGPIGITGLVITSIFIFLPFIAMSFKRIETVRILSSAFTVYYSVGFLVTEFGHYPVPVLGAGFSSVFGWYLMLSFVYRPQEIH